MNILVYLLPIFYFLFFFAIGYFVSIKFKTKNSSAKCGCECGALAEKIKTMEKKEPNPYVHVLVWDKKQKKQVYDYVPAKNVEILKTKGYVIKIV